METLAEILKKRRLELNLSLREAAKLIGISHGYLDKLEKAIDSRTQVPNKPSPDVLKLISTKYKLDYLYLLEICGYIDPVKSDLEMSSKLRAVARKMDSLSDDDLTYIEELVERLIKRHDDN